MSKRPRIKLPNPCKVGDIFCWTWGYDQQNVNFFQVISVTAKTVTIREIEYEEVESNRDQIRYGSDLVQYVMPKRDCFVEPKYSPEHGKPQIKRVLFWDDGTPYLRMLAHDGCGLWDGTRKQVTHTA